eukprot:XP_016658460.1 PREDICTED: uncharacterized protein LOC107883284 [Acyrthosiphon pisum]
MENTSSEYYPAEKCLMNITHQLLNVNSEINKQNMTSIVPSPELKDYKHAYINYSNENQSQNDNICFKSDEYDSDCSLGSLNSLYLRLKDNSKIQNLNKTIRVSIQQLQPTVCNFNETDSASENNGVPIPEPKNDKDANINHLNDTKSQNDNICLESDEYDSDCSLGSLNSLYLRLKDNSKILDYSRKQLQPAICKLSKTNSSPGNNKVTKTKTSEKIIAYDKTEDTKPIMKLNTTLFYGKQKLTSQLFTRLSHEDTFKKKFSSSKILKTRSSVCTFKYNTNKSWISSKKLKQRRPLTIKKPLSTNKIFWENKNFMRSQLKEAVPLLQLTTKCIPNNVQNNKLYSWTNNKENLLPNKIELIKDEHIIKREDNSLIEFSFIENQLYEPNHFFMNDFTDTDDFGGTIEVENIIKTLDEDDLLVDNETNKLWQNEYDENQDEIQDKLYILFKEFNNF